MLRHTGHGKREHALHDIRVPLADCNLKAMRRGVGDQEENAALSAGSGDRAVRSRQFYQARDTTGLHDDVLNPIAHLVDNMSWSNNPDVDVRPVGHAPEPQEGYGRDACFRNDPAQCAEVLLPFGVWESPRVGHRGGEMCATAANESARCRRDCCPSSQAHQLHPDKKDTSRPETTRTRQAVQSNSRTPARILASGGCGRTPHRRSSERHPSRHRRRSIRCSIAHSRQNPVVPRRAISSR